jgi:Domain of unknown function (DUF4956)
VDPILERLTDAWSGPIHTGPLDLGLALACALGCGFVIAETYRRTHRGVDYTRSFLQVLVLLGMIVAFVTLIVGDDLARAFTLVGALSVVRFRTAVKESRDLAYIFWAVGAGMGAGSRFLTLTILFTAVLAILVAVFTMLRYGLRDTDAKVLRVRLDSSQDYDAVFKESFAKHLADWDRLSVGLVRQATLYEIVYLIRLKDGSTERDLLESVRRVAGDNPVTLSHRDQKTAF